MRKALNFILAGALLSCSPARDKPVAPHAPPPVSLEGTRVVRYGPEHAAHTLYHIGARHSNMAVRLEMEAAIAALHDSADVVYMDGATPDNITTADQERAHYRSMLSVDTVGAARYASNVFMQDPAMRLFLLGRVRVRPGESGQFDYDSVVGRLDQAQSPVERARKNPKVERAHLTDIIRGREDSLLANITKDGEKNAITTYGCAHDFRDNIDRWNRAHPNDAYRLVELFVPSLDVAYCNQVRAQNDSAWAILSSNMK